MAKSKILMLTVALSFVVMLCLINNRTKAKEDCIVLNMEDYAADVPEYDYLSDSQKVAYAAMDISRKESRWVEMPIGVRKEDVQSVLKIYEFAHPLLVNKTLLVRETTSAVHTLKLTAEVEVGIDIIADEWIRESDGDIYKIADTICKGLTYDRRKDIPRASYEVTAIGYGIGVCQAYAKLFKVSLDIMGVPNYIVYGHDKNGVGHCWNMIYTSDGWKEFDLTWSDSSENKLFGLSKGEMEERHGDNFIREDPFPQK